MNQSEFISRIEEHKSITKKYNFVAGVLGYARISLLLLAGLCMAISLLCFRRGVHIAEMITILLLVFTALAALLSYHRKVRGIIIRSEKMIIINKKHLDDLERILAAYPGSDTEFLYRDYINVKTSPPESVSYSPQWEQYLDSYTQAQAMAKPKPPLEDIPMLSKVSAMKFLLM